MSPAEAAHEVAARQRLDKWLWFARVVRTRAAAADLARTGHVRVNGQRATDAARAVRVGDVLTIAVEKRILIWKVIGLGERRDSYPQARLLYEDLAPANGRDDASGLHGPSKDASYPAGPAKPRTAHHRGSVVERTRETDQ